LRLEIEAVDDKQRQDLYGRRPPRYGRVSLSSNDRRYRSTRRSAVARENGRSRSTMGGVNALATTRRGDEAAKPRVRRSAQIQDRS